MSDEGGAEKGVERQRRLAVIGLGNVLMGDDAFGPTVIGALEAQYEFSPEVAVLDLGTPGLDLTPYLLGLDAAVIVDTVSASGAAGAMVLYRRDDILKAPPQPRLSPHDPGLKEALLTVAFAGDGPREVLLVGVVPGKVTTGIGLTAAVRAAVPGAVAEVVRELGRLGAPAYARSPRSPLDLWWERA
jgi:hydrogenase maturation protease